MTGVPDDPAIVAGPSADEVAAVVAALTRRSSGATTARYEQWRHTRLTALRAHASEQ